MQEVKRVIPPINVDHQDRYNCSTAEPAALDLALSHTRDLCAEIDTFQKKTEAINSQFGLERFAISDTQIRLCIR